MKKIRNLLFSATLATTGAAAAAAPVPADAPSPTGPVAPPPRLAYAFSVQVKIGPTLEVGTVADGRRRFIPITGGKVFGPRLSGEVLPGGGDWQTIGKDGVTQILARYFLKADDGTVIEITNPGVRTGSPAVIEKLARGENVDPSLYYFRTTPTFNVSGDAHAWLRGSVFVGRGTRHPDEVVVDYYTVE